MNLSGHHIDYYAYKVFDCLYLYMDDFSKFMSFYFSSFSVFYIYTVSHKTVYSFNFRDYSVKCKPIFIMLGSIAAEKIANK